MTVEIVGQLVKHDDFSTSQFVALSKVKKVFKIPNNRYYAVLLLSLYSILRNLAVVM